MNFAISVRCAALILGASSLLSARVKTGEVLRDQLKANPANAPLLGQALPAACCSASLEPRGGLIWET